MARHDYEHVLGHILEIPGGLWQHLESSGLKCLRLAWKRFAGISRRLFRNQGTGAFCPTEIETQRQEARAARRVHARLAPAHIVIAAKTDTQGAALRTYVKAAGRLSSVRSAKLQLGRNAALASLLLRRMGRLRQLQMEFSATDIAVALPLSEAPRWQRLTHLDINMDLIIPSYVADSTVIALRGLTRDALCNLANLRVLRVVMWLSDRTLNRLAVAMPRLEVLACEGLGGRGDYDDDDDGADASPGIFSRLHTLDHYWCSDSSVMATRLCCNLSISTDLLSRLFPAVRTLRGVSLWVPEPAVQGATELSLSGVPRLGDGDTWFLIAELRIGMELADGSGIRRLELLDSIGRHVSVDVARQAIQSALAAVPDVTELTLRMSISKPMNLLATYVHALRCGALPRLRVLRIDYSDYLDNSVQQNFLVSDMRMSLELMTACMTALAVQLCGRNLHRIEFFVVRIFEMSEQGYAAAAACNRALEAMDITTRVSFTAMQARRVHGNGYWV